MSAENVLFIGWSRPIAGKELRATELFNVAVGFFAAAQMTGRIESFEPVILRPHGGDMNGFLLIRGTAEKLHALESSEDFLDLISKVDVTVGGVGVIPGWTQAGTRTEMARYVKTISGH